MIKTMLIAQGVLGTFYPSANPTEKAPVVIVISGSEGGIPQYITENLYMPEANFLALSYFGAEGLPSSLENIPLEYFVKAIEVLKQMPGVDASRIAVVGNSRGAELVLLLASRIDLDLRGVCAIVPSQYVNGGFPYPNRNAWTHNGKPIREFLPGLTSNHENLTEGEDIVAMIEQGLAPKHEGSQNDPLIIADLFRARQMKHQADLSNYEIAIENITSSVLLLTAEADAIWPSAAYGQGLVNRAYLHGKRDVTHKRFSEAGHGLAFPYYEEYDTSIFHPIGNFWCHGGGEPFHNKIASEQTHTLVHEFLTGILT